MEGGHGLLAIDLERYEGLRRQGPPGAGPGDDRGAAERTAAGMGVIVKGKSGTACGTGNDQCSGLLVGRLVVQFFQGFCKGIFADAPWESLIGVSWPQ